MKFKAGDWAYCDADNSWAILKESIKNFDFVKHNGCTFDAETGKHHASSAMIFTVEEMAEKFEFPPDFFKTSKKVAPEKGSLLHTRQEIFKMQKFYNELTSEVSKSFVKNGTCPQCGELGKYIALAPVCSKHGPY